MREAVDAVLAERQSVHGSAEDNFTVTGRGWGAILGIPDIPAWKVALMMDFFKTVRCLANPDHADNWIDKAGYTHHARTIAERRESQR